MKPTIAATTVQRPNRLLLALAAIWIVASFAIGGMVTADLRGDTSGRTQISDTLVDAGTATRP